MDRYKSEIHHWLEQNRDKSLSFLKSLINMPSTQGNEESVQSLIANKLKGLD